MDPAVAKAISEVLAPFFGLLAFGAIPVALVFLSKHFKLKTKELELEAEMHGRDLQSRLQAFETRVNALEGAFGSLSQAISPRQQLMQPPDAPPIGEGPPRLPPLSKVK
ncbi:MAG: hypothetical protein ACJ783_13735 [Myxococcales bacterium]